MRPNPRHNLLAQLLSALWGEIVGEIVGEGAAAQVRNMPSWPRSWATFSPLWLHSHRNAWAD
jgi:hypothetical protein